MSYFADLREFLCFLEEKGKLRRFKRDVVKETQMASLVMLQYRGLPEDQWRSFLFETVVGVQGRSYGNKVLLGYTASREILASGLKCSAGQVNERWCYASKNPVAPEIVATGPVHEVVVEGKEL